MKLALLARREDGRVEFATGVSPETRAELIQRALIAGSPDTVTARIREYAEVGVNHIMLWFMWGYNERARVRRSFQLFVEEVMPHFAQQPAPSR